MSQLFMPLENSQIHNVQINGDSMKKNKKYLKAESEELDDLKNAISEAVKKYGLERICVHASKFVFSISKYNVEREKESLQKGVIASTALTMENLIQNLKNASKLPESKVETCFENISEGYHFCLVSTYINKKLKIFTGLGDTFAAVQATIALG